MYPVIQVLLNGSTDITSYITTYDRTKNICSGVGTLSLEVVMDIPYTIDLWDTLTLYEESNKKGIYYVSEPTTSLPDSKIAIKAQDESKKLMDYFIPDIYSLDYPTYARYWIELFLGDAQVSYNFNTASNGSTLSENMSFGPAPAFDVITQLLQTSAWYMYFDNNNVLQIGDITHDLSGDRIYIDGTDIVSINTNKNDKVLRNKAVVWGNYDPSSASWVYASEERRTGYEHDSKDKRAVVVANSFIRNTATASSIAERLLDELATINYEKTISIAGEWDIELGDIVSVDSKFFYGEGRVTTVGSSLSVDGGLVTNVVLDEKCPRMFGYYSYVGYVYVGTDGAGVYRKELDTGVWESFSTGLDDYNVKDLIIKGGVFACVAGDYCYTNFGQKTANWVKYQHPDFTDLDGTTYLADDVEAVAVDMDSSTYVLQIGYRTKEPDAISGEYRSWIVEMTGGHFLIDVYQIYIEGYTDKQDFQLLDSEKGPKHKLTASVAPGSYGWAGGWGRRDVNPTADPEPQAHTFGIMPDPTPQTDVMIPGGYISYTGYSTPANTVLEGNAAYSSTVYSFQYAAWSGDTAFVFATPFNFDIGYTIGWFALTPQDYITAGMGWHIDRAVDDSGGDVPPENRMYRIAVFGTDFYGNVSVKGHHLTPMLAKYPKQVNVRAATTEAIILSGDQSIDGVSTTSGNLILVKNQIDPKENGIYVANSGEWHRYYTVTMKSGVICPVLEGSANLHTYWQIPDGFDIVQDSSDIYFRQVLEFVDDYDIGYFGSGYEDKGDYLYGSQVKQHNGFCYRTFTRGREFLNSWEDDIFILRLDMEAGELEIQNIIADSAPILQSNRAITYTSMTPLIPMDNGYGVAFLRNHNYIRGDTDIYDYPAIKSELICVWANEDGFNQTVDEVFFKGADLGDPENRCDSTQDMKFTKQYIELRGYEIVGGTTATCVKVGVTEQDTSCWLPDAFNRIPCTCEWPHLCCATNVYVFNSVRLLPSNVELDGWSDYFPCSCGEVGGTCIPSCGIPEDWDYEEEDYQIIGNIPLTSRDSSPRYILAGTRDVYDGSASHRVYLYTIDAPGVVCPILDEIDNGIYTYEPEVSGAVIYKDIGGTIAAEMSAGFPWVFAGGFVFSNQVFIVESYNATFSNFASVFKLKDEFMFKDQKLCFVTKQSANVGCTFVDNDFYGLRLENSVDTNMIAYTEWEPLISYDFDGQTYTSFDFSPLHFKIYSLSYTNGIIYEEVNDARTTNFGGFTLAGDFIDYGQYVFVTTNEGILKFTELNPNSQDLTDYVTFTEMELDKLEVSNYFNPQYDFVSISGDDGPPNYDPILEKFYQINPGSTTPVDYTTGGPTLPITVIRLDDRM